MLPARQTAAKLGPIWRSTWSLIAAPATILAEEPRPGWSAAFLPAWQLTTKLGPQDPPTCRGFANPANGGQVGAEMKGNWSLVAAPATILAEESMARLESASEAIPRVTVSVAAQPMTRRGRLTRTTRAVVKTRRHPA